MGDRADYMRSYREKNPNRAAFNRAANAASARAQRRLADLHPDEYERLCNEEREREGLPPLYTTPVGRPRRAS